VVSDVQLGLGFLLVPGGKRRATHCLSLAATYGCSLASAALGKIYLDEVEDELERAGELIGGDGNKSAKKAMSCFHSASIGGHPGGWIGQGVCCERGFGVSKDVDKAMALYRRAIAAFDGSFGVGGVFDQSLPWYSCVYVCMYECKFVMYVYNLVYVSVTIGFGMGDEV
jgi:hypothetical protein